MAFEKFEGRLGRGSSLVPMLTVGRSGILGLNKSAVEKYSIREHKYAELYFDPDDSIIGIKPTNDESAANCTIRDRSSGMDISATMFLRYFEIDFTCTRRFRLYKKGDMLVASCSA